MPQRTEIRQHLVCNRSILGHTTVDVDPISAEALGKALE